MWHPRPYLSAEKRIFEIGQETKKLSGAHVVNFRPMARIFTPDYFRLWVSEFYSCSTLCNPIPMSTLELVCSDICLAWYIVVEERGNSKVYHHSSVKVSQTLLVDFVPLYFLYFVECVPSLFLIICSSVNVYQRPLLNLYHLFSLV